MSPSLTEKALLLMNKLEIELRHLADILGSWKTQDPLERERIFLHPGLLKDVYPRFAYAGSPPPKTSFIPPYVRLGKGMKEKKHGKETR